MILRLNRLSHVPDVNRSPIANRSAAIDALRGLAILAVVLHHFHIHVPAAGSVFQRWPHGVQAVVFSSGYYGVMLFLVISGYLITSLSIQRWGSIGAVRPVPFYGLRFARIVPLLVLLIIVLVPLHLFGVTGFVIPADKSSLAHVLSATLTFRLNTLESAGYFLPACWGVLWSLSIEEMFYLGFPVLARIVRRTLPFALCLAVFVVLGPIARRNWPDYDDHTYLECMDGIAIGCLTALVAARWRPSRVASLILLLTGFLAVGLIEFCRGATFEWGLTHNGLYISVLDLGTAALILAARALPSPRWLLLAATPMAVVGQCSYEIYLSHSFLTVGLGRLFKSLEPEPAYVSLWYAIGTLLSVVLGFALARYFSEPANRALRACFGVGRLNDGGPIRASALAEPAP